MSLVLTPNDNARPPDVALYDREEIEARLRLFAEPDDFVASPFSDFSLQRSAAPSARVAKRSPRTL